MQDTQPKGQKHRATQRDFNTSQLPIRSWRASEVVVIRPVWGRFGAVEQPHMRPFNVSLDVLSRNEVQICS